MLVMFNVCVTSAIVVVEADVTAARVVIFVVMFVVVVIVVFIAPGFHKLFLYINNPLDIFKSGGGGTLVSFVKKRAKLMCQCLN